MTAPYLYLGPILALGEPTYVMSSVARGGHPPTWLSCPPAPTIPRHPPVPLASCPQPRRGPQTGRPHLDSQGPRDTFTCPPPTRCAQALPPVPSCLAECHRPPVSEPGSSLAVRRMSPPNPGCCCCRSVPLAGPAHCSHPRPGLGSLCAEGGPDARSLPISLLCPSGRWLFCLEHIVCREDEMV